MIVHSNVYVTLLLLVLPWKIMVTLTKLAKLAVVVFLSSLGYKIKQNKKVPEILPII